MKATKGQIKAISMVFPFKGIKNSNIIFEFGGDAEYEGMAVFDGSFIAEIPNGVGKKSVVRFDCNISKSSYSVKTKEIKVK